MSRVRNLSPQMMHCSLYLPLEECMSTFNLENAVCNHGFFMMAPNLWIPSFKTLQRPLRLSDPTTSCTVSISHPLHHTSLQVLVHGVNILSSLDQHAVLVLSLSLSPLFVFSSVFLNEWIITVTEEETNTN